MRLSFSFMLCVSLAPSVVLAQGVLGKKGADGKVTFRAVEELRMNGSKRVRVLPAGNASIVPNDLRKIQRVDLPQVGLLQKDATQRLIHVTAPGKGELILPESFAPKDAVDASAAPGAVTLEFLETKNAKKGEPIATEEFYMFAPGAPDRAGLDFVLREALFATPEDNLAAMEGFLTSFASSPLKDELRTILENRIRAGIEAFENGGEYTALLRISKFADFAKTAFASDAPIGQLQAQLVDRQKMIESTRRTLHSLANSEDWNTLIAKYVPFEPYQWSFPDLMRLRERAIEESARIHAKRGRQYATRRQYAVAMQETTAALGRDPDSPIIAKLIDDQRVMNSRIEATRNASSRKNLPKDSPEELRFKRHLYVADRAIQEKDYPKVEQSIRDATTENPGAPDILLLQARLLTSLDRHAEALPLLDKYERLAVDAAERERGEATRNQFLYDLEKKKKAAKELLATHQKNGEYSKLLQASLAALKLDADEDEFVFWGGVGSAIFRDTATAQKLLKHYLARSNSVRGDLRKRDQARRVLALLDVPAPKTEGLGNWFSGRVLSEGNYYCPESGAFNLPIESVAGFKLRMDFQWSTNKLVSVTSTFEDDRGARNYKTLIEILGGKPDPEAAGAFFFDYGNGKQVQLVSAKKPAAAAAAGELKIVRDAVSGNVRVLNEQGAPRILLLDNAQINVPVLSILEGPVATGFSGSAVFNPFIWDGMHFFTLRHDKQGRLMEAREWNADNTVRFTWQGERLMEVHAYREGSDEPYYSRRLSYNGNDLAGEAYTMGGKSGRIRYVYTGKNLQQVRIEDAGVHDGKVWTVKLRS